MQEGFDIIYRMLLFKNFTVVTFLKSPRTHWTAAPLDGDWGVAVQSLATGARALWCEVTATCAVGAVVTPPHLTHAVVILGDGVEAI